MPLIIIQYYRLVMKYFFGGKFNKSKEDLLDVNRHHH